MESHTTPRTLDLLVGERIATDSEQIEMSLTDVDTIREKAIDLEKTSIAIGASILGFLLLGAYGTART